MSYDFYMIRRIEGRDPMDVVRERFDWEKAQTEINPGPPVPAKEEKKRELARRLIELNPKLEVFPFGFKEIADQEKCTEAEARLRYRHLELDQEGGNGIQITLFDDTASLTVPYWHESGKAAAVFAEIFQYFGILDKYGDFMAYDYQLDRVLCLSTDLDESLRAYGRVIEQMPKIIANASRGPKPWWKFW